MTHSNTHNCEDSHEHKAKKAATHRIKIIAGHIECLKKMVENGDYCLDIVHQSRAIQSALKKLDAALIEDHLKTCVVDQINKGELDKTTSELLKLYEYK